MTGSPPPSASLAAVRRRNTELMRAVLSRDALRTLAADVRGFTEEVAAVGARMASPDDRASAQNILNYWFASLVGIGEQGPMSEPLTLAPAVDDDPEPGAAAANPFADLGILGGRDAVRLPGREDAIRGVVERVREHGLAFVTGSPGSGRSFLVLGGVVPQMVASPTEPREAVVLTDPGVDPLAALAGAFGAPRGDLARRPASLREAADDRCRQGALLVVDNAEDLFARCTDQGLREAFATAVASLAAAPRRHGAILIARDDGAEQLLALPAFEPFVGRDVRFTPPPPTAAEIQRMLLDPRTASTLRFEPGVAEDLARELQGDPGAFALARFILLHLWKRRQGDVVTWAAYRDLGRPNDALRTVAEATFEALSPPERAAAELLMLRLTVPGAGGGMQSRRAGRSELEEHGGAPMGAAIEAFLAAGLLRGGVPGEAADDGLELVHDNLVYRWPRLVDWLVDERRRSERRIRLLGTAQLWERSGRKEGYLLTDRASLDEAGDFAEDAGVAPFLRAGEAHVRRRRRQRIAVGVAFAAVCAVVVALLFLRSRSELAQARALVDQQRKARAVAERNQAIAESALGQRQATIDDLTIQLEQLQGRLRTLVKATGTTAPGGGAGAAIERSLATSNLVPDEVAEIYRAGAALSRQGRVSGWIWIGSDAGTNLADGVPPSATSRGNTYKIIRNIILRQSEPTSDYTQGPSLGVLPRGSTVTATGDPVAFDRTQGRQYWLPVSADPPPPRVAFQVSPATPSDRADAIGKRLTDAGFHVMDVERTDRSDGVNEIRYFFPQDRDAAAGLAQALSRIQGSLDPPGPVPKVTDFSTREIKGQPGTIELWLDLGAPSGK